jgi:hypothetical protein
MTSSDPREIYRQAAAYHRADRLAEAERLYRHLLEQDPHHVGALNMLGALDHQRGRPEAAVALIRRAIAIEGRSVSAHFNLALALYDLDRFDEAIAACRAALRLKADFAPALYTQALALKDLGRLDEAIAGFEAASAQSPDFAEAHYGEAFARLMRGDFAAGWRKYEWRRRVLAQRIFYPQPQWMGQDLAGRTLLIHAEQGQGDTIQFARYAPLAARRGARVILEVHASLVALLTGVPGVDRVSAFGERLPAFDVQCPAMSLPMAFETTLETIPKAVPYLSADPGRIAHWQGRLADRPGPRIGVAWRGNPQQSENKRRSVTAEQMAACFEGTGATLVCLQKDRTAQELAAFGPRTIDAAPGLGDFAETAALIASLDLVISVDTAVCHLAGALGAPVWTLLSFAPCWRWLQGREDSPWYPTMRLFRQSAPGDWTPVIDRVRSALGCVTPPGSA